MTFLAEHRPKIGKAFYVPSHVMAAAYILYAFTLFCVPASVNCAIAVSHWPLLLKIVSMLPITVLAGYGINMLGFVGHEGMHGSLLRNRTASALVGLFWASAVLTYFEMGFAMSHWNHHRFTNQEDDPDIGPVRSLTTWWQRLALSRPIYNWLYFRYTLGMALGRPIPFKYKMAYPVKHQVWFARANFLFAALWATAYGAVFAVDWRWGLFGIALPMIAVNFIGACQIYLDHAGLEDGFFQNARSRTSWAMTALFFGANYHLEHHAYPGVPCYRLPKLHRHLREFGVYDRVQPALDGRFFGVFRNVALPYAAARVGRDFDPFQQAVIGDTDQGRATVGHVAAGAAEATAARAGSA